MRKFIVVPNHSRWMHRALYLIVLLVMLPLLWLLLGSGPERNPNEEFTSLIPRSTTGRSLGCRWQKSNHPINWGAINLGLNTKESYNNLFFYFWSVNKGSDKKRISKVNIVTQLYGKMKVAQTTNMLTALQMNLLNPFVNQIHLLQEDDDISMYKLQNLYQSEKIVVHNIRSRLKIYDALKYVNEYLVESPYPIALMNSDVYFDYTILLVSELEKNQAFFISRRETAADPRHVERQENSDLIKAYNRDQCRTVYVGSHDAFIFRAPLPEAMVEEELWRGNSLGMIAIEKYMQDVFQDFGYQILNPCTNINVWHLHDKRTISAHASKAHLRDEKDTATLRPDQIRCQGHKVFKDSL